MTSLRALGAGYLTAATLFGLVIAFSNTANMSPNAQRLVFSGRALIVQAKDKIVRPLLAYIQPSKPVAEAEKKNASPKVQKAPEPVIMEKPAAIPPAITAPLPLEIPPAPPAIVPPSDPARVAKVLDRLNLNLTQEMRRNFDLFLYISKADTGPLSQRLYVVNKNEAGELALKYDWAASTGREKIEYNKAGAKLPSMTPEGYYQLDPDRMYRRYRSMQWGAPMPYAMFFSWIENGYQTGLAIHAAVGDGIGELGTRASAGCIRVAPENAQILYNMIRANYRGQAPVFVYDRKTQTMNNRGVLAQDDKGNIKYADGYKVLVFIENYGGGNDIVAALF